MNWICKNKLLMVFLWAVLCLNTACGDDSVFEGSYFERIDDNARVRDESSHARFHRLHLLQFGDDVAGTIELFNDVDFRGFNAQQEHISSDIGSFYRCLRIDSGYVVADKLYIQYVDDLMRRWEMSLEHKTEEIVGFIPRRLIVGSLKRIGADNREVPVDLTNVDSLFLKEDADWWKTYKDTDNKQIVLNYRNKTSSRDLECYNYYRNHEFAVVLPVDVLRMINKKDDKANTLRVGVILSSNQAETIETLNYETGALDTCDIENGRRIIRLRQNVSLLANKSSETAMATVIVYEDLDGNNAWSMSEEPVLATLSQQVLVFAKESSHEFVSSLSEGAARLSELLNRYSPDSAYSSWKAYNITAFLEKFIATDQSKAKALISISDKNDQTSLFMISTMDAQGRGCMVIPRDGWQTCEAFLPVREY